MKRDIHITHNGPYGAQIFFLSVASKHLAVNQLKLQNSAWNYGLKPGEQAYYPDRKSTWKKGICFSDYSDPKVIQKIRDAATKHKLALTEAS